MHRLAFVVLPLLVLAGCGGSHEKEQETTRTVTKDGVTTTTVTRREVDDDDRAVARAGGDTVSGLNIDSDKFKANLEIPGLTFGGDHMDLSGMKLYPGSTVKGMRVHAVDRGGADKGEVVVTFSSPAAPLAVAQHMADQAQKAGFTVSRNTSAEIAGVKPKDDGTESFDATLTPNGNATVGVLTLTGRDTQPR